MSTSPSPKLTPSATTATNAKAQSTEARLNSLIPTLASQFSPSTVYTPAPDVEMSVNGAGGGADPAGTPASGTWTCPSGISAVQVECYGGGGGGGGGTPGAAQPMQIGSADTTTGLVWSIPVTTTVATGNAVLVVITCASATAQSFTVTDTAGNSYGQIGNYSANGQTNVIHAAFGLAIPIGPGTIIFGTGTASAAMTATAWWSPDITGLDTGPADNNGTSTTPSATLSAIETDSVLMVVSNTGTETGASTDRIGHLTSGTLVQDIYWQQADSTGSLDFSTTYSSSAAWNALVIGFACSSYLESGGGGGGGGEYACEPAYPVIPGQTYAYSVGAGGVGGLSGQPGGTGGTTVFDTQGVGLAGGVVANGGLGGDSVTVGTGGAGGSGSANTDEAPGGAGGVNSSGVASDTPLEGVSDLQAWYIMDDWEAEVYVPFLDHSGNGNSASVVNVDGYVDQGVDPYTAPVQAPTQNGTHRIKGGCADFNYYTGTQIGYIQCNSFPFAGETLTISGWFKGDGSGQWGGSSATLATNCDWTGGNGDTKGTGYGLYIYENKLYFTVFNGSTRKTITSSSTVSTSAGWYYVVATFDAGAMTIYLNTESVATGTASFTSLPGGYTVTTLGLNKTSSWQGFRGALSNWWFAESVVSSSYITDAYGTTPPAGGSGGGASGGSAGTGNAGGAASGTTGGAGGAAEPAQVPNVDNGSAAGGNGGNSGANGGAPADTAPYAGGGGGAGAVSASSALRTIIDVTNPTLSASYCGSDAAGGNAGALYTISAVPQFGANPYPAAAQLTPLIYQGGTVQAGGQYRGTMNSMLILPSGISDVLSGATIQSVTFSLGINSQTAANLLLGYADYAALPVSWTGTGITAVQTLNVPSGSSGSVVEWDLSSSGLGAALKSGAATALTFGPGSTPGNAAYNGSNAQIYAASMFGAGALNAGYVADPQLTITYTTSSGVNGGAGGPGYLVITYLNPNGVPVASMQAYGEPTSNDALGNQFAAGFTGQITAFAPGGGAGTSQPETWHTVTYANTWGPISSGLDLKYALMPDNTVMMTGRLTATTAQSSGGAYAVTAALPSAYRPARSEPVSAVCHNSSSPYAVSDECTLIMETSGVLTFYGEYTASQTLEISGRYPLDA